MKTKLILTGLAMMLSTTIMSGQQGNRKGAGCGFVDENKNGVCDKKENGNSSPNCKKSNSNKEKGKCANYSDANKNGVCDNAEKKSGK